MSYCDDNSIDIGPPDEMFYDFWTDRYGKIWYPNQMGVGHIVNTIKLLEKRGNQDWVIYELLKMNYGKEYECL